MVANSATSQYVKFLRDTSPYVNLHRGKTFVLALGGDAVYHENFTNIIHDIALLHSLGIKLVLVHGARPQIEEQLVQANLPSKYSVNTRVTDSQTMRCVKKAVGRTRIVIEAKLSTGVANSPMHGARIRVLGGNVITAKPLGVRDGVDFHHTGEVRRVDHHSIQQLLDMGAIVLLSPIGYSPTGEAFNLNFEDIAAQTAISLGAEKLVMFNSYPGLFDENDHLIKTILLDDVPRQLSQLDNSLGLQHALMACYQACENDVKRGHIIGFQENGALLSELFTREGSGTLVVENGKAIIRQATIDDVGGLLGLIEPLEQKGVLVKRSRELLETEIHRFFVVQHTEGMLVGCAALYPMNSASDNNRAELACVATHPDFTNQGFASTLLEAIEKEAHQQGISELFVLTTQTSDWFQEKGFVEISVDDLPSERQQFYNYQRNSRVFCKTIP